MRNSELYFWNQISWDEEGEKHVEKQNEVHQLARSIRNRFEKLAPLSSKCCIYRIPQSLHEANKPAYSPYLISIGPFHHGKKRFEPMEETKLRYLHKFLRRNDEKCLSDYLRFIRQCEKRVREYYVEIIDMSFDKFVMMVLLDSIFVIEFFLMWHLDDADETDRVFEKPSLESVIRRDLLLLENQLPFFVLHGLYDIAFAELDISLPGFLELCCEVLVDHHKEVAVVVSFKDREILHLIDFLRTYYLPSSLRHSKDDDDEDFKFPPGIEMLHNTGVRFEVVNSNSVPLLDIEFKNGVLRIPKLEVEDHTECLLLNLSAFEQCHYFFDSYIVDYIVLMDVLITSVKDVDILMSSGIMGNALGSSEDLAYIFNTICRRTTYKRKGYYYSNLCNELNKHAKMPWNRWRATLSHDYFGNPWTIISVIVAIVLLLLTVIQTVCTVISME